MSRLSGIGVYVKVAPDEPACGEPALAAAAIPLLSKLALPCVTTGPFAVGPTVMDVRPGSGSSARPIVWPARTRVAARPITTDGRASGLVTAEASSEPARP